SVIKDAVEDGLADEVVVLGLGSDLGWAGAKILAAVTAGGVLCVEDVQPDDLTVGDGADEAVVLVPAMAALPARRAGIGLGLTAHRDHLLSRLRLGGCPSRLRLAACLCRTLAHGLRSWVTDVQHRFPRTQTLCVNSSTTYGLARPLAREGL